MTPTITNKSSVKEKINYDKWERSNRICLLVMKYFIRITIRGVMPDKLSAKSFLTEIADQFIKSNRVDATCILQANKYALQWQRKHKGVHYRNV